MPLADCSASEAVHYACGEGNTCMGSVTDWVCVCKADGWRADDSDMKKCHKSMLLNLGVFN